MTITVIQLYFCCILLLLLGTALIVTIITRKNKQCNCQLPLTLTILNYDLWMKQENYSFKKIINIFFR